MMNGNDDRRNRLRVTLGRIERQASLRATPLHTDQEAKQNTALEKGRKWSNDRQVVRIQFRKMYEALLAQLADAPPHLISRALLEAAIGTRMWEIGPGGNVPLELERLARWCRTQEGVDI